ncbi:MAG: sulfurtransferase TusA family protein [Gluconobacter potus]|uniref:Sulfurtransferase TusA family protein n=1 Tax=Gluconobacter potus TaxID=2724927 RepID=A0ABR9YHS7_9PROT|nr:MULTISPECIES: sulfurtransferase TusA family protein [Gluconobacter]MBF0863734.1 sulfurtransferase TusA family protein [Gluconobacter sp. R71656]MBF0866541.1 sulfurtransferase TusA family protein [Gluconobacter sp. R75628]MBF0872331.1 sulfurtransferase TusA family protein [Gluconobacter sp. R75629]MBF0881297.1 sulfurtransferase TusA family protein [Gluconobacter potus]
MCVTENETFFIDITEKKCPMTTVYVRAKLDTMTSGQTLEVRLRGTETRKNVGASVKALGHAILADSPVTDSPDLYCLSVKHR